MGMSRARSASGTGHIADCATGLNALMREIRTLPPCPLHERPNSVPIGLEPPASTPHPPPEPDMPHSLAPLSPAKPARAALTACLLALALNFGAPAAAHAGEPAPRRTMSVTGTGEISAAPDIAYIETGVVSEAATAAGALEANTGAMNAIFEGLAGMKIARADIQTSQFSVSPVYDEPPARPDGTRAAPKIRAYQVTNQVTVTIRKLDTLGATLDRLVQLGSNRLDGIRFSIARPEPLLDKARADAVADALRKAKLYADAAGITLGQVVSISEGADYAPRPVYMKAMMAEAAPVPVAAGTQQLSASVNLVIEIR